MILSDLDNIVYNKFANGEITLAEYIKYQNRDKIMKYEEKYKQALERAKKFAIDGYLDAIAVDDIFPELKESEGEEHRNWILEYLYDGLRKADEQFKPQFESAITWLEKQGEQSTNKVESKFEVDDLIKHNKANIICKVISVNSGSYYLENIETGGRIELFNAIQNFHLWSPFDAKEGDVLVNGSNIFIFHFINDTRLMGYCHVNINNGRFYDDIGRNECFCLIDAIVTPATKEQRELLFAKMKEAGYEWNAEKKELKKIEPKTLNPGKVVEWMRVKAPKWLYDMVYPICLDVDVEDLIKQFIKDFGL